MISLPTAFPRLLRENIMLKRLVATPDDIIPMIARIALGIVMLPHGLQKTIGVFGGYGFAGTMHFFTETMHIPAIFAVLAIAAESLGALGLIVGLLGRVAAFGIACEMIVAAFLAHVSNGFFMNWSGTQKGEGFEYHVLVLGLALIVMIRGSGAVSFDRMLGGRRSTGTL